MCFLQHFLARAWLWFILHIYPRGLEAIWRPAFPADHGILSKSQYCTCSFSLLTLIQFPSNEASNNFQYFWVTSIQYWALIEHYLYWVIIIWHADTIIINILFRKLTQEDAITCWMSQREHLDLVSFIWGYTNVGGNRCPTGLSK